MGAGLILMTLLGYDHITGQFWPPEIEFQKNSQFARFIFLGLGVVILALSFKNWSKKER